MSLQKNYILNLTRTILNLLIPLVTFPFVGRMLGPEGIGKIEFANSIMAYFVLFASLGIPNYGTREIARTRDSKYELSKTYYELTLVLLINIVLGYCIYLLLIMFVPSFEENKSIFLIIAPSLLLTVLNSEWFYIGIEDQVYITIRYICVKIIQVFAIFIFVRKGTYLIYAGLLTTLGVLSTIPNLIHLKKYLIKVKITDLHFQNHIKPIFFIFVSVLSINIYMHLDTTMLGIFATDKSVGLYTAANRIIRIVLQLVVAFSTVAIPRIENALKNERIEEYKHYVEQAYDYIMILAFPCCFGLLGISNDLIIIFAGRDFSDAAKVLKFLLPIILFVGLSNFFGYILLYPKRKEYLYTIAVTIAAVLNFIFNSIFIPKFYELGAVLGTIIAEGVCCVLLFFFSKPYRNKKMLIKIRYLVYCIFSILMFLLIKVLSNYIGNLYLRLSLSIIVGVFFYVGGLLLVKDKFLLSFLGIKKNN